jgi:hypothetical protein
MLSVTINSEKVNIPISWHEVTWKQYLQLVEPRTIVDRLSIFTGIPKDKLTKSKITGLEPVLVALKFLDEGMDIPEYPTKLGEYILPKDITLQTIEQYQILQKEIEKSTEVTDLVGKIKFVANYAAIYCQVLNEEFDYDKSIELAKKFDDYPCVEVLAAGSFFLHKLTSIERNLPMSYLLTLTRWKNLQRGSRSSTRLSGFIQRLTRWLGTSIRMTRLLRSGRFGDLTPN